MVCAVTELVCVIFLGFEESNLRSDPRFTLRTVEATVRPSPKEANGLEVTSAHATPVIKPLSLVRSETLVGTEMSIVVSVEEFAVKVPTEVLFF